MVVRMAHPPERDDVLVFIWFSGARGGHSSAEKRTLIIIDT